MKKFLLSTAALALTLVTGGSADAQWHHNHINNSGNGAGNAIFLRNGGGFPGFPGGANFNQITNSGNGVGNRIDLRNGGGGFPGGFPGGFGGGGFGGGGFPGQGGSFPGGGVFPGGVNVNVITNSGNGVGNTIGVRNGGRR